MDVKLLNIEEYNQWDTFTEESPQNSIYVKTWYLIALNIKFEILAVIEKQQIKGGIIITRNEFKMSGNPLLVKYLGICFLDFDGGAYTVETNKRKVVKALVPHLRKYRSFDFKFHPSFNDHLVFYWNGFHQTCLYTYLLDIRGKTSEDILAGVNPRLRNKVRKGVGNTSLKYDDNVDFDSFYHVNEKTFLRQGGKMPFKKERLGRIIKVLQEHNAISLTGVRDENDELLCVLGLFYDNKTAYLILNGYDNDRIITGSNEMLIFKGIEQAISRSLKTFDFEGSMLQPVESFYRQWGAVLTPYFNIWKSAVTHNLLNWTIKTYKKLKYRK